MQESIGCSTADPGSWHQAEHPAPTVRLVPEPQRKTQRGHQRSQTSKMKCRFVPIPKFLVVQGAGVGNPACYLLVTTQGKGEMAVSRDSMCSLRWHFSSCSSHSRADQQQIQKADLC